MLRAPFPYYGSKIEAAPLIESLMGSDVVNLVIPFAGSLGELLGRSAPAKIETVNDIDGLIVNAWRGLAYHAEEMADLCDHPVHEVTLHAAHDELVRRREELLELVRSSPLACDVELAAWWVWGRSCWLGGGWCEAREAASAGTNGGMRVRVQGREGTPYHGQGVARPHRTRPQLSHGGQGVAKSHAKKPRLGGQRPHFGVGVTRRQMLLGAGINASEHREGLLEYFRALAARLRWTRITCGDWRRVLSKAVTTSHGITGVSLDPPYDHERRSTRLYAEDSPEISADVRAWALAAADETRERSPKDPDPTRLRITLCGKNDEHDQLLDHGWTRHQWRNDGEVIWASPRCQPSRQGQLFTMEASR